MTIQKLTILFLFSIGCSSSSKIANLENQVLELDYRLKEIEKQLNAPIEFGEYFFEIDTVSAVKVLCPECKAQGLQSYSYVDYMTSTLINTTEGYDRNGNYFYCDPNTIVIHYHCSNGHEWEQ